MDSYRRLARSFANAGRGLWRCIKSERNLRIHFTATFYVSAFALLAKVTVGEWAAIFMCFALVIALELINSALELACDRICSERDETIRLIKDISAAAVLVGAAFAVLLAFVVFGNQRALGNIVSSLSRRPLLIACLALTVPPALIFIFYKRN